MEVAGTGSVARQQSLSICEFNIQGSIVQSMLSSLRGRMRGVHVAVFAEVPFESLALEDRCISAGMVLLLVPYEEESPR